MHDTARVTLAKSPYLCTRPFEWFEIHPDGSVFLCCPTWLKRPAGNLLRDGVEQIWNGPVAREIRKSIGNGSFHNCNLKKCPYYATGASPVIHKEQCSDLELLRAVDNRTGHLEQLPGKLNLCFDMTCNLTCPSCRTSCLSSTGETRKRAERLAAIVFEQLIPHAGEVTLSGFGDPFASPVYFNLLKKLNSLEHCPNLRLHSNGQLWTREIWKTLPNLHRRVIEAEISVDAGTTETYAVNRPGGSFQRLLENLDYLAGQPFPLTLSVVVQQNNFREIPLLLKLARQCDARLYLSQLSNWGTFSREGFRRRAVHLPEHPEHNEFLGLLRQVSGNARLSTGNLGTLVTYESKKTNS